MATSPTSPAPVVAGGVKAIAIDYAPREAFVPFHERKQRWSVLVVHRRAGKTVAVINELIKAALLCTRTSPRFAYVAPTYAQAKDVAWTYLKRFTAQIPGRIVSEAELHVTLTGDRRIRLYGSDNYDRMRGIYLDGVGIDEPADMDPAAWYDVIRPALSDREGWCVWIGTPKGRDAFWRLWKEATESPDWFTLRLPASQSRLLPEAELASAKLGMRAVEGAYEREYECSFETPVAGSIYGEAINQARAAGRILPFEWNRSVPVFSSWDLGWNDSTTIWLWQMVGHDIHWIWHVRRSQRSAADMAMELLNCQIPVTAHFIPHDGAHHKPGEGKSYKELLEQSGLMNVNVVPVSRNIWAGIDALRGFLFRSYFRLPACEKGIEALEAYHSKDTTSGGLVSKEPVHDWASHDSDAARCAAEALELGMVRTVAARASVEYNPRYPDGSMVDVATVIERRQRTRSGLAKTASRAP
jgi:phage terminase large subunit